MPDHEHVHNGNGNNLDNDTTIEEEEDTKPNANLDFFSEIREKGTYFADKSELIERIISDDSTNVFLFCRPRRFGKSINLSMLDAFLNLTHEGNTWFDGLRISESEGMSKYRNRFPVIYLNLIAFGSSDPDAMKRRFRNMIVGACDRFNYLVESEKLTGSQKARLREILYDRVVDGSDLSFLAECLHAHHGVPAVVLVDEYDAPLMSTLGKDTCPLTLDMLKSMLTPLLKNNPHVFKAVIVGVVQVAKESMFSGLNNLKVSNVFDDRGFGDMFGLTENDVRAVCEEAGHPEKMTEIKEFYDGYRIGGHEVYNPYSVMNYFDNQMKLGQYWVGTSAEDHIEVLLSKIDDNVRDILLRLAIGESAEIPMNDRLTFPRSGRVEDMEPYDVFSLLTQAGYFTVEDAGFETFRLSVPNREIRILFNNRLRRWLGGSLRPMNRILDALLEGKPEDAVRPITDLFHEMLNRNGESLWSSHQLILAGFLACQDTHIVLPENFSGDGVTDISIIPRSTGPAAIIEFKKTALDEDTESASVRALKQVRERRYALGMKGDPIREYGIAVGPNGITIHSEKGTYTAVFPVIE